MNVLHITYDYPDSINANKTNAVKNLIDISEEANNNNFYISLNRVTNPKNKIIRVQDQYIEMTTFGLPRGLFFRYTLSNSINRVISTNLDFNNFDIIHAHKLTFEGVIAYYLFNKYNKPYVVSVRQSDFKVLKYKPSLRNKYKNILINSSKIFIISPWMRNELMKVYRNDFKGLSKKIVLLPNYVEYKKYYYEEKNNDIFLMVLNMKKRNIKIKNVENVLRAIKNLRNKGCVIKLDIIGDGDAKKVIEAMIIKYKLANQIKLVGAKNHSEIIEIMKKYKCFILCSYPETFGMVYIEALISGIPIIYSKNTGIYGYFNDKDIGISVNHKNIYEIEEAILTICRKYEYYKNNVFLLQCEDFARKFSKKCISQLYTDIK